MKTKKLSITVCTLILGVGLLFAEKPTDKGKNNDLTELMVEKLNDDVQLTDSQKTLIRNKAAMFVQNRQTANLKANKNEKFSDKKIAYQQYKMVLDSILTDNQKEQLTAKQNQRRETNRNKSSK